MNMYVDICARKHGGNAMSREANRKAAPSKAESRQRVLEVLARDGMTCKEIAAKLGVPMHKVSGRLSELEADGLIKTFGRRDGGGVRWLTGKGREKAAVVFRPRVSSPNAKVEFQEGSE
jgi:predicted transcriptional regulator